MDTAKQRDRASVFGHVLGVGLEAWSGKLRDSSLPGAVKGAGVGARPQAPVAEQVMRKAFNPTPVAGTVREPNHLAEAHRYITGEAAQHIARLALAALATARGLDVLLARAEPKPPPAPPLLLALLADVVDLPRGLQLQLLPKPPPLETQLPPPVHSNWGLRSPVPAPTARTAATRNAGAENAPGGSGPAGVGFGNNTRAAATLTCTGGSRPDIATAKEDATWTYYVYSPYIRYVVLSTSVGHYSCQKTPLPYCYNLLLQHGES
ncbi:hypothetical protein FIBSPDRAFT_883801 [Athelia psychrophila]|uniref:Uncharacterized protein n=1 Tax=Athelia psychrophila TaxID=1759441 RepID=A0A166TIS1_9AGAM|nr:hypothetical protein FIBSPDRAFT_883801 [Fibularhizoctonia sp. CBS 109695]